MFAASCTMIWTLYKSILGTDFKMPSHHGPDLMQCMLYKVAVSCCTAYTHCRAGIPSMTARKVAHNSRYSFLVTLAQDLISQSLKISTPNSSSSEPK